MVPVAALYSRFLYVESCGQCPPCKLGSGEITERLERIEAGGGGDVDIEQIGGWLQRVTDGSRCYLATEEQVMVSSILRAFPDEVTERRVRALPPARPLPLPKIVELDDGGRYDQSFRRKRPDWTYEDD